MRALKAGAAALVAALGLIVAGAATAEGPGAIVTSAGCQERTLPANDDGSSPLVNLPFAIDFFGNTYNTAYVNNNGNITFNGPLSTFTPSNIVNVRTPLIAPFWADVDTRGQGSQPVQYGAISAGATQVNGHPAFCVNWVNVGYYSSGTDKLNSFQLLLVDRSDVDPGDFDIVFNYDKVQWETGSASGGSGGLGGSSARVGYSSGTRSFELTGSGVNGAFLDSNGTTGLIHNSINSPLQQGRYVFPVRNGAALGHSLTGHVWQNTVGTAVGGAFVQACPLPADTPCRTGTTNAAGFYSFNNLPDGTSGGGAVDHDWNLVVYPPGGSGLGTGSAGPVHVAGTDVDNVDVLLHGPAPLPAGATLSTPSRGTAASGVPTVYWGDPLTLELAGCTGGTGTATLLVNDGYTQTVPLVESPPGTYRAVFAATYPHHGEATIGFTVSCGTTGDFSLYIDPSGRVVDTHGRGVAGATVTLLRSDDPAGPFVAVPSGSAIMSPANRTNPDVTDATGHFGWDVLAGYYKVRAERADCGDAAQTAVLTIPPPVTDLVLVLDCPGDVTPPEIAAHGDVTAEATSAAGATVSYDPPSATDDTDGSVPVTCSPPSPSAFPLGDTTVECSAADAAGNDATGTFTVHVVDTTGPAIAPHDDLTVAATSPGGAAVTYTAPAASDMVDGTVGVTCSPASGGTFAIGNTTVTCTASDQRGNSTSSRFRVTVTGALGQLQALLDWATAGNVGPGSSIPDKLRDAIADLGTDEVCGDLRALDNEARAQTGKKLNQAQAARIRGDVARIRAVLGC
jgi:Nidogen-like/HYR domain